MTQTEWLELKERLAKSKFRSRFRLRETELRYLAERGLPLVELQCADFIRKRLAPAHPLNDGKQTPMRGHPCFIAQHATGTCCRSCLAKWHGIPPGVPLSEDEVDKIVRILIFWIRDHADDVGNIPYTPNLF